jgi:hypothetical protein
LEIGCTFDSSNKRNKTHAMKTTIEKINYFGEKTESNDWNAKVLYRATDGRLHHALIYVCFLSREFYISKKQHPECKVMPTLQRALNNKKSEYFSI